MTNLESSSEKLLQIVLSGQPELDEKLRHPSVRQLRQRIFLWCRTQPLSAEQTSEYIVERLRIAGATHPIFTPEAARLVHQHSRGIPRLINLHLRARADPRICGTDAADFCADRSVRRQGSRAGDAVVPHSSE